MNSDISQKYDSVVMTLERVGDYAQYDVYGASAVYTQISLDDETVQVGFEGCCWSTQFGANSWDVFTKFSVEVRADTGHYNNLPQVKMPLQIAIIKDLLTLPQCQKVDFHVTDADADDDVRCTLAEDPICGSQCTYNDARPGVILPDCALDFSQDLDPTAGQSLLNLQIEDFNSTSSTTPFSTTFGQFIVKVFENGFPPNNLAYTLTPQHNDFLSSPADPAFMIVFDEEVFINPADLKIEFHDSTDVLVVYHTINTTDFVGQAQMKVKSHSVEIYPDIDFSVEMYQGRTIALTISEGLFLSSICQAKSVEIEFGDWNVKIGMLLGYISTTCFLHGHRAFIGQILVVQYR